MRFDEIERNNFSPLVNALGGSDILLEKLFEKVDWENFEISIENVNKFLLEFPKFAPGYIIKAELLMQINEKEKLGFRYKAKNGTCPP